MLCGGRVKSRESSRVEIVHPPDVGLLSETVEVLFWGRDDEEGDSVAVGTSEIGHMRFLRDARVVAAHVDLEHAIFVGVEGWAVDRRESASEILLSR